MNVVKSELTLDLGRQLMDRNAFMDRIRQATAVGRAYQVALNPLATADQSYVGGGADPVASFLKEWRAVGGFGERVADAGAALTYLSEIIEKHSVKSALVWSHPLLAELGLSEWLNSKGIEVRDWAEIEHLPAERRKDLAFSADLGITSVDFAVAETGSLALCSRPGGRGRSASLLPPLHVTLLRPAQIVPDLFDLFRELGIEQTATGLPSNVVLITGPSKTGDIQLKLTTGVHGPGEVHAVVLEG